MRTIAALSSGAGRAGIAVVRVSGPRARSAVETIAGAVPAPRFATLRRLATANGVPIDAGLVLWFPAPTSYSGEDMAEFHVHGGRGVVAALMETLVRDAGCALAEPGEFTRQAFLNGKLDLTAVEGVADLIEAETEAQRVQALRQMRGGFSQAAERWRTGLVEAAAYVEAAIDFSDQDDVARDSIRIGIDRASAVRDAIAAEVAQRGRGRRIRDGYTIVIAGPPNAGKSTLMNALARRDVAITSPVPGTTRDAIEVHLDLGGWPVVLVDTAGIRESADAVEQEGVRRALLRAREADCVLWLSPVDSPAKPTVAGEDVLVVASKADLGDGTERGLAISAETGAGMDALMEMLRARVGGSLAGEGAALVTRLRHQQILEQVLESLDRVVDGGEDRPEELLAEDLRAALAGIGRLVGRVDVEEVLGEIFSSFCIGK